MKNIFHAVKRISVREHPKAVNDRRTRRNILSSLYDMHEIDYIAS